MYEMAPQILNPLNVCNMQPQILGSLYTCVRWHHRSLILSMCVWDGTTDPWSSLCVYEMVPQILDPLNECVRWQHRSLILSIYVWDGTTYHWSSQWVWDGTTDPWSSQWVWEMAPQILDPLNECERWHHRSLILSMCVWWQHRSLILSIYVWDGTTDPWSSLCMCEMVPQIIDPLYVCVRWQHRSMILSICVRWHHRSMIIIHVLSRIQSWQFCRSTKKERGKVGGRWRVKFFDWMHTHILISYIIIRLTSMYIS